jgi:tetraacyldisaccharide 4'-kinase
MRAPEFWWQPKPSLAARLLAPFGWVYGTVTARRMKAHGARAALPVLCIGNFVSGGAGKTPTAIAIAQHLQTKGEKPAFLSRGYRGKIRASCQVDLEHHSAADVGDEALLLARIAPTIIGADRSASAKIAEAIGATLLILDDGLQNASLVQDWQLAVIDGHEGIGNGRCIPAGPLRAPFSTQLADVSAVLFVGEGDASTTLSASVRRASKPILRAKLVADETMSQSLAGQNVVAFAGIGLPRKFRKTLEALGAKIAGWHSFPDHHVYSLKNLHSLQAEAAAKQAVLVTTEKDLVRIGPLDLLDAHLPQPVALPVKLVFDDERGFDTLLLTAINAARSKR